MKKSRKEGLHPRVAPRLEGVVKNAGIKPKKKPKKERVQNLTREEIAKQVAPQTDDEKHEG